MKKLLLILSAVLVSIQLQAQDSWAQKADFGGTARYGAAGFSIGSKGYIGTGYDYGIFTKDFWEYDPAINAWTQKADFGGAGRFLAPGFSIGSKGYIGTGGYGSGGVTKDFWEYNPATNQWTQKADFGGAARQGATGFSIGSKGYIGTGRDVGSVPTKDLWEYDPATDQWTQKADFGGTARYMAVGFNIGSKGYIGTGNINGIVKDFWEYDPATDQWTQKADFGGTARYGATGLSIGSKGYIGMGQEANIYLTKDFWEYDPATDQWTQKVDFGGTAIAAATGFSINSKGYIGTGSDLYTNFKDFWVYDLGSSNDCDGANAVTASIPDVYALNSATDAKNTIYIGYGPTSLTINTTPAGGTGPYTYMWSSNQNTQAIMVSSAGTYTVVVKDVKGCQTSASIVIKILDVRCGNSDNKVTVCHKGKDLCISSNAIQAHLSHGDKLGSCSGASGARISETSEVENTISPKILQPEVKVKMSVSPNPGHGQFTVQLNNINSKAEVFILTANGTIVERKQLQSKGSVQTVSFNLTNKSAGMYILKVVTEEGVHTSKVIIQK